jgi:hypothetical protein
MTAAESETNDDGGAGTVPQVESQTDRHETLIEYDHTAKVPLPVALVWICALIGLGAYTIVWLLPELALWGAP